MNFLTLVAGIRQYVSKVDFIDFASGPFRLRVSAPTLTADKTSTIATAADLADLAATTQPLDSDLSAIAALPNANGLIRKTSDGNATLQPIGAGGASVLAAADAAAARVAAGLGALATKTQVDLGVDVVGNSYVTPGNGLTLGQSGDQYGFSRITIANRDNLNGAQFETSLPLVDFVFKGNPGLGIPTGGLANIRFEFRGGVTSIVSGNTKEFQVFFDGDPFAGNYFVVGDNAAKIRGRLSLPNGVNIGNGTTQTASLRGVKTIGTPSTSDTITVAGAAVGDIVNTSRGKDGFVSATNTVQFDSTGLSGVSVTAIVERFV